MKTKGRISVVVTSILILLITNIYGKNFIVQSPGNNNDIRANFQAKVNLCSQFDTVLLPEGIFSQTGTITTTKFITILGKGKDKTILYRSESMSDASLYNLAMINYNVNREAITVNCYISGITFKSKKPSMVNGDGLSKAVDIGIKFTKCNGFVVKNCRFENFGNGAVSILHGDSLVRGLVCKNEFIHNCKGYDALGLGYGVVVYGENKKWIKDPRFGSENFIFVEDNIFDYHRHSIAAGGCALYVFRYNTVKNNVAGNTAHAIDAHEARLDGGTNHYSTRAIEVYNNIIVNTLFKDGTANCPDGTYLVAAKPVSWLVECAIRPRGGEALIHDNYIEGYRFGVGPVVDPLGYSYPVPYQVGYASALQYGTAQFGESSNMGDGDVFIWNDTFKPYNTSTQCVYIYNYSPTYLKYDRDFHNYKKTNFATWTYPHPLNN
jgi:hypothetical protein